MSSDSRNDDRFALPPLNVRYSSSRILALRQCLSMSVNALCANKMRSLLTMLGIIIGVAAVITLVSVGMGVKSNVTESISSLGSNMLIVTPGSDNHGGPRQAAGSMTTLKYEDAQAIRKKIKNIDYVSPSVGSSYQLVNGNQNWNSSVRGVTPDILPIRSLEVEYGSFITEANISKREKVAVIGTTVAENLFEEENPIGRDIRINNQPFKVVGLLKKKGQAAMGQDQDDTVYIPLTTAMERMMGITHVQDINLQVSSPEAMAEVQSNVETLLRQRHHIAGGKEDDFKVNNLTSLMEMMEKNTSMLTLLLGAIAGISLLVGGIGIMNIMMVSVTERTREIGVRKALGATFPDIMMQFVIESMLIGVAGGVIGIGTGIALSRAIAAFGKFPIEVSMLPIAVSFLFAVGTGLFFGIYPARKAAKLNPIDALRYE